MDLSERINEEMVVADATILESEFDRVSKLFDLHEDGTINLSSKTRSLGAKNQILVYFIGQRFAYEGDLVDNPELETQFFYSRMDKSDRTIRNYLQKLREAGYLSNVGQSNHELLVENLPDALDEIENVIGSGK
jgi:hypothetical protein